MIRTRIKKPSPPDSTRYIDTYLNELIDYGGEPYTRGEVIADMQSIGIDQPCIDRWLQGQELAARIRRRRERLTVTLISRVIAKSPPARLTPHVK